MNLSEALQIRPGVTAIIGGGGKTTLMERLAHELSGKARVIVCTTTHIYPEKTMPCLVSPAQAEIAAALEISEGTVKSRISRAKMRLRELLDGSGNLFDGGAVLQTEISERREQP